MERGRWLEIRGVIMEFTVFYNNEEKKISLDYKKGKYTITDEKKKKTFDAVFIDRNTLSLLYDDSSINAIIIEDGPRKIIIIKGEEYIFDEEQEKEHDFQEKSKTSVLESIIKSPMPGSVVKLNVKEGDEVKEGDILIIVEAMKMENELRASGNMKVKKIFVNEGDQVEGFAPLIELE